MKETWEDSFHCPSSRIWRSWIMLMYDRLRQLPIWPTKETVTAKMAEGFKELYPTTRVIIDCTHVFIETLSGTRAQSETYSCYKHHNSAKGLIGIYPHGSVSFVSELYGGRATDNALAKTCGLINYLEVGDSVMADRGFEIENLLSQRGVQLNSPPFMNGKPQLSIQQEVQTRRIASLRKGNKQSKNVSYYGPFIYAPGSVSDLDCVFVPEQFLALLALTLT
eukprot:m.41372 g.41372  ORF g.41372 m.41372 type:complete len:222 (+) comp33148_c0_seq1:733-1398(+)